MSLELPTRDEVVGILFLILILGFLLLWFIPEFIPQLKSMNQ